MDTRLSDLANMALAEHGTAPFPTGLSDEESTVLAALRELVEAEDCTCSADYDARCWYHLSDEERRGRLLATYRLRIS